MDLLYLKEYFKKSKLTADQSMIIKLRMKELKEHYYGKIESFLRHILDIPVVLYFLNLSYLSKQTTGLLGSLSSIICLYSLFKYGDLSN